MCKKTGCYFNNLHKCKIGKKKSFMCGMYIKEIEGITTVKDYVSIVATRNSYFFSMVVSIISLLISLCILIITLLNLIIKISEPSVN